MGECTQDETARAQFPIIRSKTMKGQGLVTSRHRELGQKMPFDREQRLELRMDIAEAERVPEEVLTLLSMPRSTVLIKGAPGTGKTILSLELLRCFGRERNGIYLSTRVSPQDLFSQYPWLQDIIEPENVLDSTKAPKYLHQEAYLERRALKLLDLTLGGGTEFIKELYEHVKTLEEPFIVADSWDAIAKELERKVRMGIEKELVEMVKDLNGRIVFVSEETEQTTLDFLVDGVLTLADVEVFGEAALSELSRLEERWAREILLNKLRGVRRDNKKYTFTLEGGRFRYFPRFKGEFPEKFEAIPDPNGDAISTGIPDLDRLLQGGYESGSNVLLEVQHGVGNEFEHLIWPTVVNALILGRGAIVTPPEGGDLSARLRALIERTDKKALDNLVFAEKVTEGSSGQPMRKNTLPIFPGDVERSFEAWFEKIKELKRRTKQPTLHVCGQDTIEYTYGPDEAVRGAAFGISFTKKAGDVNIAIVKRAQKIVDQLAFMADRHLALRSLNGALCLYGVVPQTPICAVSATKRGVMLTLTPIV